MDAFIIVTMSLILVASLIILIDLMFESSSEIFRQLANHSFSYLLKILWISILIIVFAALIYCASITITQLLGWFYAL